MTENARQPRWERTVQPADDGMRLDRFWARELDPEGISRGKVKRFIEGGLAQVDGAECAKASAKIEAGQRLELRGAAPARGLDAEDGPLSVLYEDAAVAVVAKPAGLTVHASPGEETGTLAHRLVARWPGLGALDPMRPGIVHRLDKDTSGLMVVALTEPSRLALAEQFAEREVRKCYLALVHGVPDPASGVIDEPLGRHPTQKTKMAVAAKGGREARTGYRVVWSDPRGRASLVFVRLFTGRTHQIRVHMAHAGHPLLGDVVYGSRERAEWEAGGGPLADLAPRQMLHAFSLGFDHPDSGERLDFLLPPPADFTDLLLALGRAPLRVGITGPPGCGKSALCSMLRESGLPVFGADACVAVLYGPGGDGAEMIRGRFGGEYTASDGSVDRAALFAAMRDSDAVRREVMDLVHPMVGHAWEAFCAGHEAVETVYAEVPLLVEGGWPGRGLVDHAVYVDCPDELRTGPLREARGISAETLAVFDSWQYPPEAKRDACDTVVANRAGLDELREAAAALARDMAGLARARQAGFGDRVQGLWPRLDAECREAGEAG